MRLGWWLVGLCSRPGQRRPGLVGLCSRRRLHRHRLSRRRQLRQHRRPHSIKWSSREGVGRGLRSARDSARARMRHQRGAAPVRRTRLHLEALRRPPGRGRRSQCRALQLVLRRMRRWQLCPLEGCRGSVCKHGRRPTCEPSRCWLADGCRRNGRRGRGDRQRRPGQRRPGQRRRAQGDQLLG